MINFFQFKHDYNQMIWQQDCQIICKTSLQLHTIKPKSMPPNKTVSTWIYQPHHMVYQDLTFIERLKQLSSELHSAHGLSNSLINSPVITWIGLDMWLLHEISPRGSVTPSVRVSRDVPPFIPPFSTSCTHTLSLDIQMTNILQLGIIFSFWATFLE